MKRLGALRMAAALLAGTSIGFAVATSLMMRSGNQSPQFFGALIASLIAATALIFGAFYNDFLARSRDDYALARERISEAIDLHFWMEHCLAELDFIAGALNRLREKFALENKPAPDISLYQFKEIISSHFYNELLERAKTASKLPPEIAGYVTGQIYKAFTTIDRIIVMRHASDKFLPSTDQIDQYAKLISMQKEKLD